MGRINLTLKDDLEKRFRSAVADTIGFKKGNLQVAVEEALEIWIREKVREKRGKG